MPRYPGYLPPFQYYRPYNYSPHTPTTSTPAPNVSVPHMPASHVPAPVLPQPMPKDHIPDVSPSSKPAKSDFPVWFDLFGIKLFFDDVLIISLLFFLYKEQVKDEGLFLALLLLLIS